MEWQSVARQRRRRRWQFQTILIPGVSSLRQLPYDDDQQKREQHIQLDLRCYLQASL